MLVSVMLVVAAGNVLLPDEAAAAPVQLMTLPELEREETRAADPPSLIHPIVAIAVGAAFFLGFGSVAYWVATSPSRPGTQNATSAVCLVTCSVFAGTGLLMALIGGSTFPATVNTRRELALRRIEVHEQIAALKAGQATAPLPDTRKDYLDLERKKPSLAPPIALMVLGTAPVAIGASAFAITDSNRHPDGGWLATSITLIVAGALLEGLGLTQLSSRLQARDELDAQIHDLAAR